MSEHPAPSLDEYGLTASALVGLSMFSNASRRSGRTTRMIERVTKEDIIIVPNRHTAEHIKQLLHAARKSDVPVRIVDVADVPMQHVGTRPNGRAFFDHTWMEDFLTRAIKQAAGDIETFQRAISKTWPHAPEAIRFNEEYRRRWDRGERGRI